MANLLVLMPGGTSPVINATLAVIIKLARRTKAFQYVLAGFPGIEGIQSEEFIDLISLSESELARLRRTPGSALTGTTRIPALSSEHCDVLSDVFVRNHVGAFIDIGGNGTVKQTKLFLTFLAQAFLLRPHQKQSTMI